MNRYIIIILFSLFTLFACNDMHRKQIKSEEPVKMHAIDSICVAYVESHLDGFNNEITREKTSRAIQRIVIDTLSANSELLYDLPLKYESAVEKGNKYIVRFSTGYCYNWTDRKKCDIDLWFYSIVGNEIIDKLKDKETYYLNKAKFMGQVNNKIELPNGDTFDHKPHVTIIESPLDTTYMIGLGGLYIKDVELKEAESRGIVQ